MSKKLDKIMDNKQVDEREIYENGKIYKDGLEKIVIITEILYWIITFIPFNTLFPNSMNREVHNIIEICINSFAFIVNFIGFTCITKSIKKGVFGGNIKKSTYAISQFFIMHLILIIFSVIDLIGISDVTRGIITLSYMALIAPTLFIYDYIIYKKYIKYNK